MNAFRVAMRLVSAGLTLYMLLIVLRIILSWFRGPDLGRPVEILHALTDPYLRWFRRFEFLKIGNIDFSVFVGLIALLVASSITNRLAFGVQVTFGIILGLIIWSVASAARFLLVFFLALALIRLIGSVIGVNTAGRVWITLDHLLEPIVHKIVIPLFRGRFVSYRNALLLFCTLTAVTLFVGWILVEQVVMLAGRIPF